MQKLLLDLAERSAWTGAEAPVALLAASAKSWVAGRLGRKGTASTLPASADPASLARGV